MDTVYRAAANQLRDRPIERRQLRWRHNAWALKSAWLPQIVAVCVATVALLFAFRSGSQIGAGIGVISAIAAAVLTLSNLLPGLGVFNAAKAKAYTDAARDPIGPLTARYTQIVKDTGRPVAVFIDDLDRCDAEFVCEVLQTIQTLFREAQVLYVVAADRDWLCSAYEQVYGRFMDKVGEPGRSLGHMFVEKVFQLSVEVPQLSEDQLRPYWKRLVDAGDAAGPLDDAERKRVAEEVDEKLKAASTQAEVRSIVKDYAGEAAAVAGARAATHVQVSPELRREREHFLLDYTRHLEPNPRALKRMVNAYGFKLGQGLQRQEETDPDALVRWTILENRWPLLAQALTARTALPDAMKRLLESDAVQDVVGKLDAPMLDNVVSDPRWVAGRLRPAPKAAPDSLPEAAE